jgi:hypothetical protein
MPGLAGRIVLVPEMKEPHYERKLSVQHLMISPVFILANPVRLKLQFGCDIP